MDKIFNNKPKVSQNQSKEQNDVYTMVNKALSEPSEAKIDPTQQNFIQNFTFEEVYIDEK